MMKYLSSSTRFLALGALAATSQIALVQAAPKTTLKLNGKVASTKLKTIGGVAYVPVADVAKALGQKVLPTSTGLEIKTASGTYQAGNLTGKVNDIIQTKKYSFQVLGFTTADKYDTKNLGYHETYEPKADDETLVIVNCRIKNTVNKAQGPVLDHTQAGNKTAITDYEGQSYQPLVYDSKIAKNFSGQSLLPGSKNDFYVVFSVPKSAKIKDLVFSVNDYFDPLMQGPDVRIHLK
ncbi:DUF4352 domain-containing protein [bacterium]|nr:MAG: DUF4352 domain-containing protein [bacterium]